MKYNTEADAIAAANAAGRLGRYDAQNVWHWDTHYVIPNMKAWRISQNNPDGTHNYLAGWFCIVATNSPNVQLDSDPALQFALIREGPPWLRINNISAAILKDLGFEPVFAGCNYPMGGVS